MGGASGNETHSREEKYSLRERKRGGIEMKNWKNIEIQSDEQWYCTVVCVCKEEITREDSSSI